VLSLPNLLTLSRIFVIPLVVATFYVDSPEARWTALVLFALAAVSDFFDGWLARRWNQVSALGRFLDPIADKLLVAAILFMLVAFDRMSQWSVLPAVVILCREILVSGLREFLAELQVGMPVTKLAKWKTTFQMIALPLLLIGDAAPYGIPGQSLGEVFLWVAAVLTIITGHDYLRAGLRHMTPDRAPAAKPDRDDEAKAGD